MKLEADDQMILLHFNRDDQSLSNLQFEEKKIKDEFIDKLDPSIDKFTFQMILKSMWELFLNCPSIESSTIKEPELLFAAIATNFEFYD